jgi:MoaA/NifB/PqqE/SkfB family radical SAM enzyme
VPRSDTPTPPSEDRPSVKYYAEVRNKRLHPWEGTFDRTLRGFREAVAHGLKVLVACVILEPNRHNVENIFALAEGTVGVKVQTLIERGRGAEHYEELHIPEFELKKIMMLT